MGGGLRAGRRSSGRGGSSAGRKRAILSFIFVECTVALERIYPRCLTAGEIPADRAAPASLIDIGAGAVACGVTRPSTSCRQGRPLVDRSSRLLKLGASTVSEDLRVDYKCSSSSRSSSSRNSAEVCRPRNSGKPACGSRPENASQHRRQQ